MGTNIRKHYDDLDLIVNRRFTQRPMTPTSPIQTGLNVDGYNGLDGVNSFMHIQRPHLHLSALDLESKN